MAEGLKVRFRQSSDSTTASEEYWVVANPGMPEKWREDPSIPLTHVLQSFDIFRREGVSGQAPQADLLYVCHSPNNTRLHLLASSQHTWPDPESRRVFGTADRDEVIKKILAEGDWPAERDTVFQQHKTQRSMKK
jgi:ribosome maturation protein Sdo1